MKDAPAVARRTGNQSGRQPRAPPQPLLERPHGAFVPLVIVAQKVQKAMQGQNPQFRGQIVPLGPGLASGDTQGDRQVAEVSRGLRLGA